MQEVLDVLFDITNTLGAVLLAIGGVLIAVACAQVLAAFARPFLVGMSGSAAAKAAGCCVYVSKTLARIVAQLVQPQIHIPLLIGAGLVWLALNLQRQADKMRTAALTPLQSADASLADDIVTVNEFIESVPNELIGFVNKQLVRVAEVTDFGVRVAELLDQLVNAALQDIEGVLHDFLEQIGVCPGSTCPEVPTVDFSQDLLEVTSGWMPSIPALEFETLPPELVSLERMFGPIIEDLHTV